MYKIITDSTCDLPVDYLKENDIDCIHLSYVLDGVTYGQDNELLPATFFKMMREGKMPTTSQINPLEAKSFLEGRIQTNKNILFLSFSSGLSGSYNSVRMATQEIMEEHEDINIRVVDTLCASMGEGLLVYKAVQMKNQGMGMEELADWIEENKLHFIHVFTVDDLFHLFRGGRVSRSAAVLGTLAGIKPMLHVDNEGHLIPVSKVRGRKKSLHALVDYMAERRAGFEDSDEMVMISHGDVLEDAEYVRNMIQERFGIQNIMINSLGPVIGSHTGPGLVALFFMGSER